MRTAMPLKNRTSWKYNAFVHDNTERIKMPEKTEVNLLPVYSEEFC